MLTQILRIGSLDDQLLHLLRYQQLPLASSFHTQMTTRATIERRCRDNRTQIHGPGRAGFEPLRWRKDTVPLTSRARGGKVAAR